MGMLGVTGAPFFNGSVSKYLIKADFADGLLKISLLLINLGTVLYFLRISRIFGRDRNLAENISIGQIDSGIVQHNGFTNLRTDPVKKLVVLVLGSYLAVMILFLLYQNC